MIRFEYVGAVTGVKETVSEKNGRTYRTVYFAGYKAFNLAEGVEVERGKVYRCTGEADFGRTRDGRDWHSFVITGVEEVK